jgi:hypothetical protein
MFQEKTVPESRSFFGEYFYFTKNILELSSGKKYPIFFGENISDVFSKKKRIQNFPEKCSRYFSKKVLDFFLKKNVPNFLSEICFSKIYLKNILNFFLKKTNSYIKKKIFCSKKLFCLSYMDTQYVGFGYPTKQNKDLVENCFIFI